MDSLLDECLDALGGNKKVLSESETEEVFTSFTSTFPITNWGVIDWSKVDKKVIVSNTDDIKYFFEKHKLTTNSTVHILWNDNSLPSINVAIGKALEVVDDVTAVGFDTWLYNENEKYVIEFHHEGQITIGFTVNFGIS